MGEREGRREGWEEEDEQCEEGCHWPEGGGGRGLRAGGVAGDRGQATGRQGRRINRHRGAGRRRGRGRRRQDGRRGSVWRASYHGPRARGRVRDAGGVRGLHGVRLRQRPRAEARAKRARVCAACQAPGPRPARAGGRPLQAGRRRPRRPEGARRSGGRATQVFGSSSWLSRNWPCSHVALPRPRVSPTLPRENTPAVTAARPGWGGGAARGRQS